jgi:hypothetical protein
MGRDGSPMGRDGSPMGRDGSPMGRDGSPMGRDGSRMKSFSSPMGRDGSPMGRDSDAPGQLFGGHRFIGAEQIAVPVDARLAADVLGRGTRASRWSQ